jgi:hypothetical protein
MRERLESRMDAFHKMLEVTYGNRNHRTTTFNDCLIELASTEMSSKLTQKQDKDENNFSQKETTEALNEEFVGNKEGCLLSS